MLEFIGTFLDQVRLHTDALELCVVALDIWCRSVPSRSSFFVASEDRGGQQQHGPASIWQLAEVMAIVQRAREATRSSAFACELRALILHVRSLSPAISVFSAQAWFEAGQSWNSKATSCSIQARCACGKPHRELRGTDPKGRFATQVAPLFPVEFWSSVLEGASEALRDGVSIQARKLIKRIETK